MTTTAAIAGTAAPSRLLAARRAMSTRMSDTALAGALSTAPAQSSVGLSRLANALGGTRGMVDGGLPPLVFVVANAVATAHTSRTTALALAIGAAVGTAAALVGLRLARRETLKQAIGGLAGLAIAVVFALRSGEARGFFLPGIYVDAAYAVGFAVSALVGRPLVATLHGWLFGRRPGWRESRRLRRAFTVATVGWALVYASRVLVQVLLYEADRPGAMAASKILMGWPLTILAVALTLAYIRSIERSPS
jgi:hypothetical protein